MKDIIKASTIIDNTINLKIFQNARVLVFDENNHLIVSEELEHILFKTYKMLKNYELIDSINDLYLNDNEEINTIIIFAKEILKGE